MNNVLKQFASVVINADWLSFGRLGLRFWVVLAGFMLLLLQVSPSFGQSGPAAWTPPVNLASGLATKAVWDPEIAADAMGNLHVVWRGWTGPDYPGPEGSNTVFYTWWNGTEWSLPVDIFVGSGNTADTWTVAGDVDTTRDGRVVVAWWSQNIVMVSYAPIGQATDARSWTTVPVDGGAYARLGIDPDSERWYVSYASSDFRQIMFSYSDDYGDNWSPPVAVWSVQANGQFAQNWDLYVSSDSSVHMAWKDISPTPSREGAIWYARLPVGSASEFEVREVVRSSGISPQEPTVDAPKMAGGPDGILHLFWNNGVASATGRFHQWSDDFGATWSAVETVFPSLSGQTQEAGLAVDSNGVLHLATAAQGDGYSSPIRYAMWQADNWSNYVTLWPEEYEGERPALAITQGNSLHLVWQHSLPNQEGAYDGLIMYSTRQVDALRMPPEGFVDNQSLTLPTPTGAESTPSPEPTVWRQANSTADLENLPVVENGQPINSTLAVLLGVVPALAIVLLVLVVRVRHIGR